MTRVASMAALLCAAAAMMGCAHDPDRGSLEQELRARVQSAYVEPFKQGDIERWVGIFTDDALALHDGPPPMKGRDQIRAFGERVKANFDIRVFDVVVDEVRTDGRWALTTGHYTAHFVPRSQNAYAGAAGPRQGKFLFLWERRDGVWRIMTDMGNSTDPPPPAGAGGGS
jgi:uncharacterized protein (TIGR02246 family)